jgi:hypothetical protein
MTHDEALDQFQATFAEFEVGLSRAMAEGVLYTPDTAESVAKLISASIAQHFELESVAPGSPIPVPGRDAVVIVTAERADAKQVFRANITISGPDAWLVAREWGIEDLVEPVRTITIEIPL